MADFAAMVKAVRADKKVGRGTCTEIDECYTDDELIQMFKEGDVESCEKAVTWCRMLQRDRLEDACNYRWGMDSDPELQRLRDWDAT